MSALPALVASTSPSNVLLHMLKQVGRASLAPFRWYHRRLAQSPLVVKSLTSGTVVASADLLSQWLRLPPHAPASRHSTEGIPPPPDHWWNMKQTFGMALYGALFVAPFSHTWYQFLERRLPLPNVPSFGTKLRRVLQRVALDQLVVSPVFATGLFLSRGFIAGEDMHTIWQKTRSDFIRVVMAGVCVWPPAQMVNFFFVPLHYRVLFINMVGFGWSTYTSLVAARAFSCDERSCHEQEPSRRGLDSILLHTFSPRYMWLHAHPYTAGKYPIPATPSTSCWRD